MKRILVKSVYDAFEYVMDHYYPHGLEDFAGRKDTYVVISIQDTHTDGFGICFTESKTCRGVLTLYFDDIIRPVEGAVLFNEGMALQIISFIEQHCTADTLLIHCYGGESRSRAVGAFAAEMLGGDSKPYFATGNPNEIVYNTLKSVWKSRTDEKNQT